VEGTSSIVAVLALYRVRADAFTGDDLAMVQALSAKLGTLIEGALLGSGVGLANEKSSFSARAGAH
jgi:hypothetical protein